MNAMNATKARANLFKIMAFVNDNSQPLTLTNSKGNNVFKLCSRHDRIFDKWQGHTFRRMSF